METFDTIKERRSVRGFSEEKQIADDKVEKIIESAFFAPLALNKVCWRLAVVQDKKLIDEMVADIIDFLNVKPSEHVKMRLAMPKFSPFYHAPTVIFVMGDKENEYTGSNCGAAIQNMLLCAKDMGIDSCWIGMANKFLKSGGGEKYMKILGCPAGYEIIGAVALGYGNVNVPMPNKHFEEKDEIVKFIK